ncbi:MAG: mechanosensitive ion channel protein [Deltaproteobacteria bacterium CG_4_9_14_3_um_filter_51_14]|nr:MAG: mechanosensitive ion channel protein [Deltaproteobacteria bacterium CG_4_9_14_3_um_filter_51_14]
MRAVRRYLDAQQGMLLRKVIYYLLLSLFVVSALREMGFSLGALLGAAGVFTVAIGFASQTSASNLISGIFLIGERSFQIGDFIKVGDTTGEVLSIDLLSVKLRTLDNLHVRIPNETMIKSEVTNLTKFPIRRVDLKVGVAYKEDIGKVRRVLLSVADKNPLCLEEPKPRFYFLGFGDSSLDLQFSVWVKKENFLDLRTSMHEEIKAAFDREGIEIPFPHLSIYTGSVTEPMPIAIMDKKKMTEMVEDEQTLPQGGENTL